MSVTQAMEWLIEHADDPAADAPLPNENIPEAVGDSASADPRTSLGATAEEPTDELTEIFKKIRRKREFRPDPRVC